MGDWQETLRKPSGNGKPTGHPWETHRTHGKPAGNLQETCRNPAVKPTGNLRKTHRKATGIPRETSRKPAGNVKGTDRKPTGNRKSTRNPRGTCKEPVGNPQEKIAGGFQKRESHRKPAGSLRNTSGKPAGNLQRAMRYIKKEQCMPTCKNMEPYNTSTRNCGNSSMKLTQYRHIAEETHSKSTSKQNQRQGYLCKPKAARRKP